MKSTNLPIHTLSQEYMRKDHDKQISWTHSFLPEFWSWQIDNNINGKKQHTAQKVNYIAQHMYINLNKKKTTPEHLAPILTTSYNSCLWGETYMYIESTV